jgi:hypothetical protein
MNREDALAYITSLYGSSREPYLVQAGIPLEDTATGVGVVIDDALLACGVGYTELVTGIPSNVRAYRAALRYYALDLAWTNINDSKHLDKAKTGDVEVASVEWRKQLMAARDKAARDAVALGADIPDPDGESGWPSGGWSLAGVNLDYIEPEASHA